MSNLRAEVRPGAEHSRCSKFDDKEVQVDESGTVRLSQSKQREFGAWRKSALKYTGPDEDVQDACREEVLHQDAAKSLPERVGMSTGPCVQEVAWLHLDAIILLDMHPERPHLALHT